MTDYIIESWPPTGTLDTDLHQLATLLHATVHDGASVSFILPFTHDDSLDWWRTQILPQAMSNQRQIFIVRHTSTNSIVAAVHLILDMPPNQRHRAEVAKLLVHPNHRRHGLARALSSPSTPSPAAPPNPSTNLSATNSQVPSPTTPALHKLPPSNPPASTTSN